MKWLVWLLLLPSLCSAGVLENTAIAAYRDIQTLEHHQDWEYGGIIVIRDGAYQYSAIPVTSKKKDSVFNDPGAKLLHGDKLAGVYHTHPCVEGYWTGLYSINDLIQQLFWHVPAFILDQCTMKVHEIDLSVDKVFDTGTTFTQDNGRKVHLPAGRIVGQL